MGAMDTAGVTLLLERVVQLAPMKATAGWRLDTDDGKWDGFEVGVRHRTWHVSPSTNLVQYPAAYLSDMLIHTTEVGD